MVGAQGDIDLWLGRGGFETRPYKLRETWLGRGLHTDERDPVVE